ncbi:lipid-transfer protein [Striga asiatica]|uniref:Lipid-transfer protein n=1 Tax=Striga asiatica TaxID=4170 RepID=A0A5A7PC59_STRAF|nr:lipid-transfer protein [Striga asiatica]
MRARALIMVVLMISHVMGKTPAEREVGKVFHSCFKYYNAGGPIPPSADCCNYVCDVVRDFGGSGSNYKYANYLLCSPLITDFQDRLNLVFQRNLDLPKTCCHIHNNAIVTYLFTCKGHDLHPPPRPIA